MAALFEAHSLHVDAHPAEPAQRSAVLLDSQPLFLDAVERLLGAVGVSSVARHTVPAAALAAVSSLAPDVLVLQVRDERDVATVAEARRLSPRLRIVALAPPGEDELFAEAFDAGATIVILRSARPEDLALVVRQLFERSIYLAYTADVAPPSRQPSRPSPALTRREREIVGLVAQGHPNKQIARLLWVTEQTVKFHLSNAYRKLNVTNRTEASLWAHQNGLVADAS